MAEITAVYGGRASIQFHNRGMAHFYTVDIPELKVFNLSQPSVTGIIGKLDKSAALVNWAVRCMHQRVKELLILAPEQVEREMVLAVVGSAQNTWRDVKDETAEIGSLVHRVLEQELNARAGLCEHPELPVTFNGTLAPNTTRDMIEQANAAISAGLKYFNEHEIKIVEAERVRWSPTYGYLGTGDLVAYVDGKLSMVDYKTGKRLYPTVWLQLAAYQMAFQEENPDKEITQRVAINVGRDGVLDPKSRNNETLQSDFAAFLGLLGAWRWDTENTDYKPKAAPRIVGAFS